MADKYIRKQDVIDIVRHECGEWKGLAKEIVKQFNGLPSADVAPAVHAHWIRHENADIICGYYVPSFECSQCGAWKEDDSDFCPDCGAKMDAQKEE